MHLANHLYRMRDQKACHGFSTSVARVHFFYIHTLTAEPITRHAIKGSNINRMKKAWLLLTIPMLLVGNINAETKSRK